MNIKLPENFLERMKGDLGDKYEDFLASYDKPYRQSLRLNLLKADAAKAKELTAGALAGAQLEHVPWTTDGYYYNEEARPGKSPLHDAGLYYIQEPSAMIVSSLADAKPGEFVLDLCAAPGGKTTALASSMRGEGILVANEIHPARAKILSENVERMGITNCFVTNEAPDNLCNHFPAFFDKIVVDAPCSGEGMFRKEPAALECWSMANVAMCASRQKEILKSAMKMLAPGGVLVYSTCTFAPEEDEMITAWLEENYSLSVIEEHKMYPHEIDGEGHYCAVLKDNSPHFKAGIVVGKSKTNQTLCNFFELFAKDNIKKEAYEKLLAGKEFLSYGDNLYAAPRGVNLAGLKCLRPGLCLGAAKKDRFEPSHAFALAMRSEDVNTSIDINLEDAARFIEGQTLPAPSGIKGWTLVTVCGISLGWGKTSGGVVKNHFPKGLRHQ